MLPLSASASSSFLLLFFLTFLFSPCSSSRPLAHHRHQHHHLAAELMSPSQRNLYFPLSVQSLEKDPQTNLMEKDKDDMPFIPAHVQEVSYQLRIDVNLLRSRRRKMLGSEEKTTTQGSVHTDYVCADSC